MIQVQRVYDHASTPHAQRFLVERLWPRGIRKESLHFDAWLKDVAPSDALRKWFHHDAAKWTEFRRRYRAELDRNHDAWAPIVDCARRGDVVLLFSSRDTEHNNAVALRDYIDGKLAARGRRRAGKKTVKRSRASAVRGAGLAGLHQPAAGGPGRDQS